MKRRLIKLALIASPLVAFYLWSFLGLGILAAILIAFRVLTWKYEPKVPKENSKNNDTDEDDLFDQVTSLELQYTCSAININHDN